MPTPPIPTRRLVPLLLLLPLLAAAAAAQQRARPNLLLVVTDDQRFDQMGCAGHPVLETPTIDGLARRGVRFTNAFVTTAICAASRASILTGRTEGHHRYTFGTAPMGRALADDTYLRRLHAAGYRTGFVGKWGVRFAPGALDGALDFRRTPGQPYRRDGQPHLTDRVADAAIAFLDGHAGEAPFCLSVSFHAPHAQDNHRDQYIPPADLEHLYADAEVPPPANAEADHTALPPFLQDSLGRVRWHWRFDTREKQVRRTRDYWRMITGLDRALGRILAALERRGLADDTVVVFTSDNGYFLGERGLAGKWLIYEESVRVPLIVVDPRAAAGARGRTEDRVALNIDLAPTLLDFAGVAIPRAYDGLSLVPVLRGDDVAWRRDWLYEHRFDHARIPPSVGVHDGRWVYARYDRERPAYEQLFDLVTDPGQRRNLAGSTTHDERLRAMRARCDELLRR